MQDEALIDNVVLISLPASIFWVLVVWGVFKLVIDGITLWTNWRTSQQEIRMEKIRAKAYADYLKLPE